MTTADDEAFTTWARERVPALRRTAFLICGDWHLADDLLQTALVKIYAARPPPDPTRINRANSTPPVGPKASAWP